MIIAICVFGPVVTCLGAAWAVDRHDRKAGRRRSDPGRIGAANQGREKNPAIDTINSAITD